MSCFYIVIFTRRLSDPRQVGESSPVPGGVGPSPPLLAPFVLAALICQSPGYSSLISSCVLPLREVGLTGERAAAQPEPAVETPERPEDRRRNNTASPKITDKLHHNEEITRKLLSLSF